MTNHQTYMRISTRLIALLITTMQILAVIAGLSVLAYFGTHSDCNGYWGFNEHGTYVCQRAVE